MESFCFINIVYVFFLLYPPNKKGKRKKIGKEKESWRNKSEPKKNNAKLKREKQEKNV